MRRGVIFLSFLVSLPLFLSGCGTGDDDPSRSPAGSQEPRWLNQRPGELEQQSNVLVRVMPEELPDADPTGNLDAFRTALTRQLERCAALDPAKTWQFGERTVTRRNWCTNTSSKFLSLAESAPDFRTLWDRARREFHWYKSAGRDGDGEVLFTGYYLPLLRGSRTRDLVHTYPLYRKPLDLVSRIIEGKNRWRRILQDGSLAMHGSRADIDWKGILSDRQLEIAYVDDPIEAFFLHIQGSGVLETVAENGAKVRTMVNYAAQNGHPYVAIGKVLKDEGVDAKYLTLQGLRQYFRERPAEINRVFPQNPSYVFFNEADSGPYGSGSTILTEGHSIATDNGLFPLGAVSLFATQCAVVANQEITAWENCSRFAVNQDTGGAIKGPGRVGIFWGAGEYAELAAGSQKSLGQLYFAVVSDEAP